MRKLEREIFLFVCFPAKKNKKKRGSKKQKQLTRGKREEKREKKKSSLFFVTSCAHTHKYIARLWVNLTHSNTRNFRSSFVLKRRKRACVKVENQHPQHIHFFFFLIHPIGERERRERGVKKARFIEVSSHRPIQKRNGDPARDYRR